MKFVTRNIIIGMGGIINSFNESPYSAARIKRIVAWGRLRARHEKISRQSALKRYWFEKSMGCCLAFALCMACYGLAILGAQSTAYPLMLYVAGVFPPVFLVGMALWADSLERHSNPRRRSPS